MEQINHQEFDALSLNSDESDALQQRGENASQRSSPQHDGTPFEEPSPTKDGSHSSDDQEPEKPELGKRPKEVDIFAGIVPK